MISRLAIATLSLSVLMSSAALAGPIEDRQQAMKNVGKAMGQLAAIAKKEAPFDAVVVQKAGATIAENVKVFMTNVPQSADDDTTETWAKPEIWQNMDDFKSKGDKSVAAAMAMAGVTDSTKFSAALGGLGGSCKGCHQDYRRPKQ